MKEPTVDSPCVNVCVLGIDNICTGCFRTVDEIASWGIVSKDQQQQYVANAAYRKGKATSD